MKLLGAIIAGGGSRRFGGDKGAALLDGRALIDHVADALAPQVDAMVVSGREWPGLNSVADYPAPDMGPLGGLCGMLHYAAQHKFDAVLTAGCDVLPVPDFASLLPSLAGRGRGRVSPPAINSRDTAYDRLRRNPPLAPPFQGGEVILGQPLFGYWPAALADKLTLHLATQSDHSMRHWIATTGAREVPCDTPFHNLNTRADFALYSASQGLAA